MDLETHKRQFQNSIMNYSLHTAITTLAGNGILVGLHGLVVVVGIIIGM